MKNWILSHGLKLTIALFAIGAGCSIALANDTDNDQKSDKAEKAEKREKWVEERRLSKIWKTSEPVEGFESVEMFEGMASGTVDVTIKPKDASDSTMIFTNKTDKPLAIQVPATFSAVPVMRQFGGGGGGRGGGGGGGRGGGGGGGIQQGIGGGGGGGRGGGGLGGGGGGRGGGGGGGVFNIPAGKTGKLKIKTVCLEHGKPDPRSSIEYRLQPLENLTDDPKVAETIRMLAEDEVTQNVAQATTWHLTDGLSFESMLTMNRVERMGGYFERFFSVDELKFAVEVLAEAGRRAELRAELEGEKESVPSSSETEMVNSESTE